MSRERYISVDKGTITMVTENDGYSLASRGPEREENVVTLEELKGTRFYEEAKESIANEKRLAARKRR